MRIKKICLSSTFALSVALIVGAAPSAEAEPVTGQLLANQCAQCHDTNGSGGFRILAGKSASTLYKQLLSMKSRSAPQGIMDWQARGYTDEQLWLVSEYLSQQVPPRRTTTRR